MMGRSPCGKGGEGRGGEIKVKAWLMCRCSLDVFPPSTQSLAIADAAWSCCCWLAPIHCMPIATHPLSPSPPHHHQALTKFVKKSAKIAFELPKKAKKDEDEAAKDDSEEEPAKDEL